MQQSDPPSTPTKAQLGLWDTASLIIGIIVGVGIFFTPAFVFGSMPDGMSALLVWLVGGLLCMVGALCFAELASTYPRSGGEYVYLTRAYGRWTGFLFAWAQFVIIRPAATIAAIAYPFANYTGALTNVDPEQKWFFVLVASLVIAVLTGINILGVRLGKQTQNTLTVLKLLSISAIVLSGFVFAPQYNSSDETPEEVAVGAGEGEALASGEAPASEEANSPDLLTLINQLLPGITLALILVLWTYAGWHEAAYVVAEIHENARTIPRALLLGTFSVIVVYMLIISAYWYGLGYEQAGQSKAIAADLLSKAFGPVGRSIMAGLIMLSCLGALNGAIFTGSRLFTEIGTDHPLFAPLGKWNVTLGTPVVSLLVQGVLSIAFVIFVGLAFSGSNPFESLLQSTATVFWLFFLLTGISLFISRVKDPHLARPFRTPGYPITPTIFCAFTLFMVYQTAIYKPELSLIGLGLLACGLPLYFLSEWLRRRLETASEAVVGPHMDEN